MQRDALHEIQIIRGVQVPVKKIFVSRAVKLVGAALHHLVELAARGGAAGRAELIPQKGEFRYGIVGNARQGTRDAAVVVVDAIDREVVVARALAPDARTGAYADATATTTSRSRA